MRIFIPLRFKVFFLILLAVGGTAFLFDTLAVRGLEEDRTYFGLEMAKAIGDGVRAQVETTAKMRLSELEKLSGQFFQNGEERSLFLNASSDFRSDILSITFFEPRGDDRYAIRTATNWDLLKSMGVDSAFLQQLNQNSPLDINHMAKQRETTILNRSFEYKTKPTAIQSYVLFGKTLGGEPRETILVADALAESLCMKLRRADSARAFLVSENGFLIAHPEPAALVEFRNRAFPSFPLGELPANWQSGTGFAWEHHSKEWLSLISPTGLSGIYVSAQVEKGSFLEVFGRLEKRFLYAAWALLGFVLLLGAWLTSRLVSNIRNTAATLQCLAEGDWDRIPKIRSTDEFQYVKNGFNVLIPELRSRLRGEFELGQKDSLLTTAQTLRAAMASPSVLDMAGWETVVQRPKDTTMYQEFWDFYSHGARRQIVIGRANIEGLSGLLLATMVRSSLDCFRKLSAKFSPQRPISLAELLEMLNATIYSVFKGRVCLVATAFELDVDSGNVLWINAGGPVPFKWKPESDGGIAFDDKTLAAQSPPIGIRAQAGYRAITAFLPPGESIFVHAETVRPKDAAIGEDSMRPSIETTLAVEGAKALADVKASLLAAPGNPALKEGLVFVSLRRSEAGAAAMPIQKAA